MSVKVRLRLLDDYSNDPGCELVGPLEAAFRRKPSLVHEAVAVMFAALVEREIVEPDQAIHLLNDSLPEHKRCDLEFEIVPPTTDDGLLV
ncbi:hypothetical protein [Mesorhizobium sp.]|uniref:hypothetical protein n=1 Tax=Mesorhizobium sp. TaxID=1871066 RepID=UPI000FE991BE|nr:hypothetical protein [Mesorhizobium sp.]RWP29494.1 MAG: hypothetical protein EOR03_26570 [Mesorhizobium sp.]